MAPGDIKKSRVKSTVSAKGINSYKLLGDLPSSDESFWTFKDDEKGQIILYGSDCETGKPSIHLVEWASRFSINIANEMLYFSDKGLVAEVPLPNVRFASLSFMRVSGVRYIFLFGGKLADETDGKPQGTPVSYTYWFNIDQREWSQITQPSGGAPHPQPRVGAASIAVGSRVYFFGGHVGTSAENTPKARSYSAAEIIPGAVVGGRLHFEWKWVIIDKAYPRNIKFLGSMGSALLLSEGKEILLLPGSDDEGAVEFGEVYSVIYRPERDTFTVIPSTEFQRLPCPITWYTLEVIPPCFIAAGSNPILGHASFIMSTNEAVLSDDDPIFPRLWAVTMNRPIRIQEIIVKPRLTKLYNDNAIDFFTFCSVRGKLGFLGSKGRQPASGSAYLAEIDL